MLQALADFVSGGGGVIMGAQTWNFGSDAASIPANKLTARLGGHITYTKEYVYVDANVTIPATIPNVMLNTDVENTAVHQSGKQRLLCNH